MVGFGTKMIGAKIRVNFGDKDFRYQGSLIDTAKKMVKSEQDVEKNDVGVDGDDQNKKEKE